MTRRRDFIRQAALVAAGSVAAGSAAAGAIDAQSSASAVQGGAWDMSWSARVTGKYRMAFDAPEVSEGTCLHQVRSFLRGYSDVYGLTDADLTAILIVRHAAVPMVLGDALWADGAWGEKEELQDPATGLSARRNPFVNVGSGSRYALTWDDGALDTLIGRGVIVLACEIALGRAAGQIAARRKIPREDARQLVKDHLLPGVIRMPSGIFAASHAQSLGCGVLHAA